MQIKSLLDGYKATEEKESKIAALTDRQLKSYNSLVLKMFIIEDKLVLAMAGDHLLDGRLLDVLLRAEEFLFRNARSCS